MALSYVTVIKMLTIIYFGEYGKQNKNSQRVGAVEKNSTMQVFINHNLYNIYRI